MCLKLSAKKIRLLHKMNASYVSRIAGQRRARYKQEAELCHSVGLLNQSTQKKSHLYPPHLLKDPLVFRSPGLRPLKEFSSSDLRLYPTSTTKGERGGDGEDSLLLAS